MNLYIDTLRSRYRLQQQLVSNIVEGIDPLYEEQHSQKYNKILLWRSNKIMEFIEDCDESGKNEVADEIIIVSCGVTIKLSRQLQLPSTLQLRCTQ